MPSRSTADRAPAPRHTGALPLRPGDPDRIGPYVSLGLLGSGGMGRVYLARPADGDPDLVAVKVIRPEYAEDIRFRRRFEREASVHGRVLTPHLPRLRGTGFQDELLWMATEYVPGLDLADAVQEDGALALAAVWRLVAELGRALADLSAAGIVHRDLKPSNVLLSARGAHVIDFGISKAADASAITGTGNRVGTPAYMSPEYLRTGECDTASDVFSLACTLVYAATGSAPFGDGTGVDVMHRVAFEEPNAKVIGEVSAADEALASLLSACLGKEPGARPTPKELIEAAGAHAGTPGTSGSPGTSGWPEPLGGRVLARQQAYEALRRLPLAQPSPEAAAHPSAPPSSPPNATPKPSADAAGQSPPAQGRNSTRRKRVLAGVTGVALCATVAAGVFVLTRPDSSASASPEAGTSTAAGGVPGATVSSTAPGASGGAPVPDGGSSVSEVSGKDDSVADDTPRPDASADHDRRTTAPSGSATESGAPPETAPSQSSAPPDSGTPAWISDCTHYSGNGRTRLGNSGKRVLQVQCILTKRGYGVGDSGVDGEFGTGTEAAVQAFQSDKGLDVDGVVGHDTWAALRASE
ncbi:protein kinase domain-containing protein [Streptomyces capitiformicae]|uniref:protein kinase domain-containing protein n=1 Tax=Streptomyces capitiformicae TaxID=2014920 RepID=UPI00227D83FA|nr:protein kinase [Streptomyces capitiformicae]